jgi:hypothetical protein
MYVTHRNGENMIQQILVGTQFKARMAERMLGSQMSSQRLLGYPMSPTQETYQAASRLTFSELIFRRNGSQ